MWCQRDKAARETSHVSPKIVVQHQGDGDHDGDGCGGDVVALHRGISILYSRRSPGSGAAPLAASFFFMVVLLSHSLPTDTLLRCSAVKPRRWKNSLALSLASTVSCAAPRAAASFSSAS